MTDGVHQVTRDYPGTDKDNVRQGKEEQESADNSDTRLFTFHKGHHNNKADYYGLFDRIGVKARQAGKIHGSQLAKLQKYINQSINILKYTQVPKSCNR